MQIRDVEMPNAVIDAQHEGRLVIFAGAGVSRKAPSKLPNFRDLVSRIAGGLRERKRNEPWEVFLGRLKLKGTDVHRLAKEILDRRDSRPNSDHALLVELFREPKDLRIVTTNFDRHLERAIDARWPDEKIGVFEAPALPVGSEFSGLVHLHGQLGDDPNRLILTDADYGRAYMTEGWARRFVVALFKQYTVLFVGYSYSDAPLKYLARGLAAVGEEAAQERLFALTPGQADEWNYLGIKPILYSSAQRHRQLGDFLRSWTTLARRGVLDADSRLEEILAREPWPLDPREEEELHYYLAHDETDHLFYKHAKHANWLYWAQRNGLLKPLFEPGIGSESLRSRSYWFAGGALGSRGDVALQIAWGEYRTISHVLAVTLAHQIGADLATGNEASRAAAIRAASWLQLILTRSDPGSAALILEIGLPPLNSENQAALAIWCFRLLAEPRLGLDRREISTLDRPAALSIDFAWKRESSLANAWKALFRPQIARFAPLLLPSLTAILAEADLKLQAGGALPGRNAMDVDGSVSSNLKEPIYGSDSVTTLIGAACDVLNWHLRERPKVAEAIVEIWLASEAPLLLRLGLYGIERLLSLSADEKVNRVVESKWLALPALRSDLWELLRATYPKIKEGTRRRLLKAARQTFHREESTDNPDAQRFADYTLNGLLVQLEQVAPGELLIKRELARLAKRRPELEQQRELDSTDGDDDEGGFVQAISPVSTEELKLLSSTDWLKSFEEIAGRPLGHFQLIDQRQGFLEESQKIAAESFSFGIGIAEALVDHDSRHSAWPYLFRAWGERVLLDGEWEKILSVINRDSLLKSQAANIVDFLEKWSRNRKANKPGQDQWHSALSLAEKLWSIAGDLPSGLSEDHDDFLAVAINSPAGKLAEIVIQVVSGMSPEGATGKIPEAATHLITEMCIAQDPPREFAACVLASRFRYLRWLDDAWARANLEPRFDWNNPRHAVQAWHGLLYGNVDTSFVPLFEQAFSHLVDLGDFRGRFVEYVVYLAVHSDTDLYKSGWLRSFLRNSEPDDRFNFSMEVNSILEGLTPAERGELWHAWLGAYFHRRFVEAPSLADTELEVFAHWAFNLGPFLGEILGQLERRPSPICTELGRHFFYQLARASLEGGDPTAVVKLSSWVLHGAIRGQFREGGEVRKIIQTYTELGAADSALETLKGLLVEKVG